MLFFFLIAGFAFIYNVAYCVHSFRRKRILSSLGALCMCLLLVFSLILAYNAI